MKKKYNGHALPESRRNGKSKTASDIISNILTETVSVSDKFQGIKLGSKFLHKGEIFQLKRRTKPITPGSTTYVGELYLYSKKTNEFIFHYAVSTEFTPIS